MQHTRQPIDRWFLLLCSVPLLVTASVYLEASLAAAALGHWPTPSVDDPKDLLTWPLHVVAGIGLVTVCPSGVLTLTVAFWAWRAHRLNRGHVACLALLVTGFVMLLVLARTDPGRVWYWWWD